MKKSGYGFSNEYKITDYDVKRQERDAAVRTICRIEKLLYSSENPIDEIKGEIEKLKKEIYIKELNME